MQDGVNVNWKVAHVEETALQRFTLIQVNESHEINSIKVDDIEIKLSAFSDDTDFSIFSVKSLKLIFDICSNKCFDI